MNGLPEIILREMAACGSITFARFMELSLYCPQLGYYEQIANTPGRRGDFYTSVSVGPLFGELLAAQFAQWLGRWETPGVERGLNEPAPDRLQLLEAGAHDGGLAADILGWFKSRRAHLFDKLEYWILEPSPRRQRWQKKTLDPFNGQVLWFDSWEKLPPTGMHGIVFSNELLDAMPVHRLGWDAQARTWFEWGVAADGGQFVWKKLPLTKARGHPAAVRDACVPRSALRVLDWPELPAELMAVLPDGFAMEICPAAVDWWREAAAALKQGWLLTMDYGLTAEQFIGPERAQGTLRAYYRHQQSADLLASPGEQDLTAHVNLTALQKAGESAGLKTEGVFAQGEFLTRIAQASWGDQAGFAEWTPARTRQFQTLTHPEHLGRQFKLLLQTR
jgi:SAM-dependent MidA family methyltransferase